MKLNQLQIFLKKAAIDVILSDLKVSKQDLLGKKGDGFNILLRWIATVKIEQSAAAVGIG